MRLFARRVANVTSLPLLASVLVAGCYFPFGGFGGFDDDQIPFPTVLAEYSTGSAQIVLTHDGESQTVTLDQMGRGSSLDNLSGAAVSWKSGDGWILQVTAYDVGAVFAPFPSPRASSSPAPNSDMGAYSGEVTIQRISGAEFWTASSYSASGNRCIVDIVDVSASVVEGSATCRGLRWSDGTAPNNFMTPVFIEDQEPFDAEITFEARP